MQTLIIRVYQRSRTKPEKVGGVIEIVGTEEKSAFQSFPGLISALKHAVLHHDDPIEHVAEHGTYSITDKKQAG